MDIGLTMGLGVFVLAGICNGSIALPQKFVRSFAWENTWGSFFFLAMIVVPALVIPFLVRDLGAIWSAAGIKAVSLALLFGMLWGVGCITFGVSIHMLGLSMGFTLIMGIVLSVGSLLPLAVLHPERLVTTGGFVILFGIALAILGVVLGGYAGMLKSRAQKSKEQSKTDGPPQKGVVVGILVSIASGITSACLNLGFAFSSKITDTARKFGAPGWAAGLASWQLLFWGGFITCGIFCSILTVKNRTWRNFALPNAGHDFVLTLEMAVLHFVNLLLYGMGAYFIGALGTSLGFASYTSISIIAANILGFMTGEWRGVGNRPVGWIVAATIVLVVSVCVLGYGNGM
jgi:L-rhamnose-H+ transport protein